MIAEKSLLSNRDFYLYPEVPSGRISIFVPCR
jgi:hypothetical protein